MYDIIKDYIDLKITALNTTLTTALSETTATFDMDKLPSGQMHRSYEVRLNQYDRIGDESDINYNVQVNITLTLGLFKKNTAEYETLVDEYVHRLVKLLRPGNSAGSYLPYESGLSSIYAISDMSVSGLNDVVKTNYLQPTISFKAGVIDGSAVSVTVPDAPTLTTPASGGTSTTGSVIFNWTGTADTWNIEVSLNGTVVLSQTGLTASSFTVPADSTLSNGDYTWRVRGVNAGGLGAWATAQTFTVDTAGVSYDADAESYFTRTGVVGDTFKQAVSDFFTGLKADSLFTGHDAMWIMAAPDADTAKANTLSSSYTCTLIDAPTFTADQGYTGDGSNDAINTNFNLSTNGVNFTQNDAGYTLYQRVATPTDAKHWCGAWASGAGGGTYLYGASAGSVLYECNNAGGVDGTSSRYNAQGVFTVNRSSSSSINFNANTQRVDTEANTSAARRNLNMYVLALNNNGSVFAPANIQVAYFAIHRAFTAVETAKYQSRIQILMATIGANV